MLRTSETNFGAGVEVVKLDEMKLNSELSYDITDTATDPPLEPIVDAILIVVEELVI